MTKQPTDYYTWKSLAEYYREASTQVSQIMRQATLGSIGLVWLFAKKDAANHTIIPRLFGIASAVLLIAMLIDLVQYYYTSWVIDDILLADKNPEIPGDKSKRMHELYHAKLVVGGLGILLLAVALANELVFR
jgi:hypothetical protein